MSHRFNKEEVGRSCAVEATDSYRQLDSHPVAQTYDMTNRVVATLADHFLRRTMETPLAKGL
jgi:hypothetical protein